MDKYRSILPKLLPYMLLVGVLAIILVMVSVASENKQTAQSNNNSTLYSQSAMSFQYNPDISANLVKITTNKGSFEIQLSPDIAPKTVSNFAQLIMDEFYDGLTFHRYEPGFVIQGGDPDGNGTGGPGYTVPAEISPYLQHEKGAVAMARLSDAVNPEKESSGSQFYITLDEVPFLDGEYTVLGKVISGMDVVEQLRAGDIMQKVEIIN